MPNKPKVVFDTNIYISAIIFGGAPFICLEMARNGELELYASKAILLELTHKLESKFLHTQDDVERVLIRLSQFTKIITPIEKLTVIKDDQTGNKILEAAMEAKADYLISGDKRHVLPLKEFRGTKIVSAAEFLKEF
ncbi:MAG: putative toxin-antitoxin system toxin component, PIN family [Candidatus Woykebacteria bacterium RBG_16_43_9]|uniref:Putative toxin-antitoxin system toxin component, PIN family n=1 Tax=Candidatus Woykebacteria bacterium RBG_16_43_9 TaxID=1802596 RepID=A0A1G1WC82_9BACT|nr:MAG: putative toxin-antitoxin system toxin component, PIN family [Candidatus Woykebacteria bacterium RBG_16_43_9]